MYISLMKPTEKKKLYFNWNKVIFKKTKKSLTVRKRFYKCGIKIEIQPLIRQIADKHDNDNEQVNQNNQYPRYCKVL